MTPHSALSLLSVLLLLAAFPGHAAPSHSGTWSASVRKDQLQLSLRTKGEGSGQTSTPVPRTAFQELSTAEGSTAPFRLVREAGTFHFEGRFTDSEGAGHFRFEPSEAYTRAMAGLGYPSLTADQQYQLALFDVGPTRVKELAALGYKDIPFKQLIEVAICQVTPEYVRALAAEGFKNLELEQLLALSIHGVTPEFIREVREMGYPNATADDLVKLRIHGIDSAFVRSLSGRKGGDDARKKP